MRISAIIIIGLFTFLLIQGCTQHVEVKFEQPADLIPRDSMVDIIVDLQIMESILTKEQKTGRRQVTDDQYYLYNSVMDKYHLTRERFKRSFDFYQGDLEVLDKIYADAITKLTKMKTSVSLETDTISVKHTAPSN